MKNLVTGRTGGGRRERDIKRAKAEGDYTVGAVGGAFGYEHALGVETTEGYRGIVTCRLCGAAVLLRGPGSIDIHSAWHQRIGDAPVSPDAGGQITTTSTSARSAGISASTAASDRSTSMKTTSPTAPKAKRKLTPEKKARHARLGIGEFTMMSQGMHEAIAAAQESATAPKAGERATEALPILCWCCLRRPSVQKCACDVTTIPAPAWEPESGDEFYCRTHKRWMEAR